MTDTLRLIDERRIASVRELQYDMEELERNRRRY